MGHRVEFRVLGPLQVLVDGEPVVVRAGRQRALLVSLLMRPGSGVSVDELAEHVWGADPPARARGTLQTYVMRLRQVLGPAVPIRTAPDAYLIDVDERTIDVVRFEQLVEEGEQERAAGRLEPASALFTAALALWRGPAMVDVPSEVLHRDEVPRLGERRLHAEERRVEVDLELGRHAELIPELYRLTSEHPLRERLWSQLMVALCRSGRQADALGAYRRVSGLLADELGIDPGDELRRVHQQVLSGAPAPAVGSPAPARRDRVVPSQLPADIGDFVGREQAVELIEALLRTAQGVPVVTLAGPPGVGKTALAVHAAHRMRQHFPDGQLYVNLRGYAQGPPLKAVDVLPRFLRAQGVPPESVPLDQDEQEAMFRSRLTDQQVLLVLDNAASAEQIRPLLPGSPGCAVLVTSRDTLRGLAVSHAASNVRLDVLDAEETRALLAGMLGADVVAAQAEAADELAELCAHLPLALRIAAANLLSRPETTIASYVEELRAGNRLAALAVEGDERAAVHAAFDLSYTALKPELASLFRLLSLAPGDITPDLAAALGGLTTQDARRRLDRLATANLVDNHAPGRYQFHDLLRDYAAERLAVEDDPAECAQAHRRLLDWSIRSVDNATDTVKATLMRLPRDAVDSGVAPRLFATPAEALAWLDAERANLVALVLHSSDRQPDSDTWQLADALRRYFYAQGLPVEWLATAKAGLSVAQQIGDPVGEVAMLSSLGVLYWAIGQHRVAVDYFRRAIPIQRRTGAAPAAEAAVLANLGGVYIDLGELEQAAECLERALVITRGIGALQQEGIALLNLGGVYLQLGQLDRAVSSFEGSLDVGNRLGVWITQADSYRALAEVHLFQGRPERAAQLYERAGDLYERASARGFAHIPHEGLAHTYVMRGRFADAISEASRALGIAEDLGNLKGVCDAKNALGEALHGTGRHGEAVQRHTEALRIAEETGYPWGICAARRGLALAHRAAGRLDEARYSASQALDSAVRYRLRLAEVEVLALLGRVRLDQGDVAEALDHARRSLELSRSTGQRFVQARAAHVAGDAAATTGDHATARAYWTTALECFTAIGCPEAAGVRAALAP
ncbi:AfsR/SARP family transcriptional regulator [Saccharothrix algeriensis]|uniref:DNA-binding SARP family transcriptional activator/Tfp pilus assembly protein PilF n=1 Tax=Saccharothrix algeriensis TaxID=173560 RepID=A0A8T8I4I8_9PSEU|nr:BTAD domain-containing putative transcriptional regulator [Saccharothrix algeriensis]MBM7811960.1 DNA-binding SARP family transcriptional activator/Tfp pilus assembly protein PilF [Saccharothrix algeriensis]QTR05657.1 tetratricopeptide repeat protein [Saccharothrix algeriensis]